MQLLTSGTTPFGRITRIVNQVHGLNVEEVPVRIWQEREKVVGINPLSQLPVLLLDDGTPIMDSRVIADYLDSLATNPLLPSDPDANLRMRSDCALWHGVLSQAVELFAPGALLDTELPAKLHSWHFDKIVATLEHHETTLAANAGTELTMLDVYAVAVLGFIEFRLAAVVDWRTTCPKLAQYFDFLHTQHVAILNTVPKHPPA